MLCGVVLSKAWKCASNPNPKNSPLGPPKVDNDPKINSKSNLRIEENIENESCSTT